MTGRADYSGRVIGAAVVLRRSVAPDRWVIRCGCTREAVRSKAAIRAALRTGSVLMCGVCLLALRAELKANQRARGNAQAMRNARIRRGGVAK